MIKKRVCGKCLGRGWYRRGKKILECNKLNTNPELHKIKNIK